MTDSKLTKNRTACHSLIILKVDCIFTAVLIWMVIIRNAMFIYSNPQKCCSLYLKSVPIPEMDMYTDRLLTLANGWKPSLAVQWT